MNWKKLTGISLTMSSSISYKNVHVSTSQNNPIDDEKSEKHRHKKCKLAQCCFTSLAFLQYDQSVLGYPTT